MTAKANGRALRAGAVFFIMALSLAAQAAYALPAGQANIPPVFGKPHTAMHTINPKICFVMVLLLALQLFC